MAVLGTLNKPIKLGSKGKITISSSVYKGESKQNYNDNYDRIFGGTKNVSQQKENG